MIWARSRITLQVYLDKHKYFDQVRCFDAWAKGSVIFGEPANDMSSYGVQHNQHLICANLDDFPTVCRELLADPERRSCISINAQQLLREKYTTERWIPQISNILNGL